MNLTKEKIEQFWNFMLKEFDGEVVDKNTSNFMSTIGWALDTIGVVDQEVFIKRFVTVIPPKIYIPFELGVANDVWDLEDQITVCVHECQHLYQANKDGIIPFSVQYLTNKQSLAAYEAQAYVCNLELSWFLHKRLPDIKRLSEYLYSYNGTSKEVSFMRLYLEACADPIQQGALITQSSKVAIPWLKENV